LSLLNAAKVYLAYSNPLLSLAIAGAEAAAGAVSKASEKGTSQLKEEVAKQNLQMQFAQHQARVAQEIAIARRIEGAVEVEIEEFYDTSGKGNLGLEIDGKSETASFGLGAEGRRVTKRIYKFKGWLQSHADAASGVDVVTQEA